MHRGDKGSVLVMVMVAVAIISGLVVMLFDTSMVQMKSVDNAKTVAESRTLAQSGLDIASARIASLLAASGLTTNQLNIRLAATVLGNLNTVVVPGSSFAGADADLAYFVPFGSGFLATEIGVGAAVVDDKGTPSDPGDDVTTRYVTVRATGVGSGKRARSIFETVFKEVTTMQTTPLTAGTHAVGGGLSTATGGSIPHNVHYYVDSGAKISGYDHDIEGVTADPTDGVAALSLSSDSNRAWEADPGNSSPGVIEGPVGTGGIDNASDDTDTIQLMTSAANTVIADTGVIRHIASSGNPTWELDGGTLGTPDAPVVVHVNARNHDIGGTPVVEIKNSAKGYGFILVTLKPGSQINGPVVKIDGSGWHGFIIIDTGVGTKISDHWIVEVGNDAKVVGGIGLLHRVALSDESGNGTSFEHQDGITLKVAGNGKILYSSDAVARAFNATGTSGMTTIATTYTQTAAKCIRVQ